MREGHKNLEQYDPFPVPIFVKTEVPWENETQTHETPHANNTDNQPNLDLSRYKLRES